MVGHVSIHELKCGTQLKSQAITATREEVNMITADIIVIGAGMAGLSVAATLAREACVLVLESEKQTGYHSTSRSAAMLIRNYGSDILRELNHHSFKLYRQLEQELDQMLLSTRGELIVACEDEAVKFESYLNSSTDLEEVSIQQALSLCPALREEKVVKAAIEPEASDIDVDRLLQHYIRRLKSFSGEIYLESKVNALACTNQIWQLDTSTGIYSAPIIINAAGAWADVIAEKANIKRLGMMPLRRSAAIIGAPGYQNVNRWPVVIGASENWYAKPQSGKLIVSPADEDLVEPHDAWPEDTVLAEGLYRFEQFMDIQVKRIEYSWAGLRTFVKDRNPVVGFSDEAEGFFWLAGQGGYGIQTAPVLAQLASDIILKQSHQWPAYLTEALSPGRQM